MKRNGMRMLVTLLLGAAAPIAFAQHGGGGMGQSMPDLSVTGAQQKVLMQATKDQRMALANCMAATQQVRLIVDQMARSGSPWRRGRVSYDRSDLKDLTQHEQQLEAALTQLAAAHQEFQRELTPAQVTGLEKRLRKLDRLRAKLDSGISQIDHDLTGARPGAGSPEIEWDVYAMKKAAGRWRSEHRKIAKEMSLTA